MIKLTGFNGAEFFLNCDLIEKLESTPDTIVTLTTERKFVVKESPETIIERIIEYKRNFLIYGPEMIKRQD